jgi:hypothetical protein
MDVDSPREIDVDCYKLGKRMCKKTQGCDWDSGDCIPSDESGGGEEEVEVLRPQKPKHTAPEGWYTLKGTELRALCNKNLKGGKSGKGVCKYDKIHKHDACVCKFYPAGFAPGGEWCFCEDF